MSLITLKYVIYLSTRHYVYEFLMQNKKNEKLKFDKKNYKFSFILNFKNLEKNLNFTFKVLFYS